jgi:UPF0755 protein
MDQEKPPSKKLKKIFIGAAVFTVVILGAVTVFFYLRYFRANVTGKQEYLYIHTGATYADVYKAIQDEGIVKDAASFNAAAEGMHYTNRVKPGRYRLREGMTNRRLINMLASGAQEAVELSFHNLRQKTDFAGFVSKKLEADSTSIIHLLDSTQFIEKYGFNTDNVYAMFIPNTYQVYWNTSPEKFFKRMYANYEKYWTPERKQQASAINLSPIQVSILASIVDAEALHDDEMPTVAGLYLNRLRKGMKLESDPTLIFALQDFTIKRVLNRDKAVNSPYNTYLHTGLPPGPIMMPSENALNSVLGYKKTDYLYMCAKADFSGYHAFASNITDHNINARKWREALDARKIKR